MDITVQKSDLFRELQYVQGVVERKTTVPILSNLLLETVGDSLVITATDLDVTLRCACKATVASGGAVTVVARKLFDIVRLLPDAEIHFKAVSNDRINVTCERSRFKVAGLSKENFPDIPSVEGQTVTLPSSALRYMITRSIFAITQEESRYTLNGALMIVTPTSITMVATDGHRLVHATHACDIKGVEGEVRVLVPKKTLSELSKLTSDETLPVEFGHTENHLFFRVGERLLVSRKLTGQFPNYEMVIPRDNTVELVLDSAEFANAIRRVAVMADEQSRAVRFSLSEGQLEVSSESADFGEAKETIPAEFSGDPMQIGFNAHYLLDFLGSLESEQVAVKLRDKETQGLLKPKGVEACEYSYVVMPMKI